MALYGTLLFHLNLRYSAVEVEERALVVERCYRPLLGLLDELPWLRIAVEASAHTLELVHGLDPDWVAELGARWREGRVEFVGSGDTQLIGPLVPEPVNRWNQALGVEAYERLFGRRPTVALVNEMAWSQGAIDSYLDAGYRTLLMEWNNPHKHHREWPADWRYRMAWSESARGRKVELAWVDSVAFQKFQRAVHDDLDLDEYVDWVAGQAADEDRHLFLYASDAEVFDHRPGRYEAEAVLGSESEWARIATLLAALRARGVEPTLPSEARAQPGLAPRRTLCLRSAADPVPVKKQPKYNVSRWALSGRDDLALNARCHARARRLVRDDALAHAAGVFEAARDAHASDWRELCRAWASDLRTHLTGARWRDRDELLRRDAAGERDSAQATLPESLPPFALQPVAASALAIAATPAAQASAPTHASAPPLPGAAERAPDTLGAGAPRLRYEGRRLDVEVGGTSVRLSLRRGLALEALRFEAAGPHSLLGTVPHGAFDDIDWAADFYSGHLVADIPARRRVTDLVPVEPAVRTAPDRVTLDARLVTPLGPVEKRVTLTPTEVRLRFDLGGWRERPLGSTRLAFVMLDPEAYGAELWLSTTCGGPPESFPLVEEFDHGASVSPLISATAALGASDGWLGIDDGRRGVLLTWDPCVAPALPLVTHRFVAGRRFLRIAFSLGEVDETAREGASLPPFELCIRPWTGVGPAAHATPPGAN